VRLARISRERNLCADEAGRRRPVRLKLRTAIHIAQCRGLHIMQASSHCLEVVIANGNCWTPHARPVLRSERRHRLDGV
jgi:hypothetical protein